MGGARVVAFGQNGRINLGLLWVEEHNLGLCGSGGLVGGCRVGFYTWIKKFYTQFKKVLAI